MDKEYGVYKELVATATATAAANAQDLMHERKPLKLIDVENNQGDLADPSTWELL